jgi:hypothetical protein
MLWNGLRGPLHWLNSADVRAKTLNLGQFPSKRKADIMKNIQVHSSRRLRDESTFGSIIFENRAGCFQ